MMKNMYMNPTQIFDKPNTQVCTQKRTHTKMNICPCMCNTEKWKYGKPIFSIWFCISVVCAIFSSINPSKHPQDLHLMCTGISILPLQLIESCLLKVKWVLSQKVETSQHLKDASYKIIGMQ